MFLDTVDPRPLEYSRMEPCSFMHKYISSLFPVIMSLKFIQPETHSNSGNSLKLLLLDISYS